MTQATPRPTHDNGNSSSTTEIDWNDGPIQKITLNDNPTLTFTNPLDGARYLLHVIQDATGSRTVTWPTIKWIGGSAPTLTTTVNKRDIVVFVREGSDYYGAADLNF